MDYLTRHIIYPNRPKAFWIIVVLQFLPCFLISQQLTLSRQVKPKVIFKKDIKVLFEDSYGFIWMGGNGLYKYDGYTPKRYFAVQTDSILSNMSMGEVHGLLENQDGNLWIGAENGLFFYNRATDKVKKVFDSQLKNRFGTSLKIYTFLEDRKGRIWIGGADRLVLMSLEKDTTFQVIQKIKYYGAQLSEGVRSIRADSRGGIWVATTDGLWEIKNDLTVITHEPERSERNRAFAIRMLDSEISKGDTLWLVTSEGLWNFDIKNNHFAKISLPDYDTSTLRELLLDEKNHLWIGTRKNILVRYSDGNFRWIAGYPSHLFEGFNALIKDRFGNLWAGTNGKVSYLNLLTDQMLPLYQVMNGPPSQDNSIFRVMQDSAGGFWFRMLRSGLGYIPALEGNFEILLNPQTNIILDEIKDFCTDVDGNVWVITLTNGLYLFERGKKKYRQLDFGDSLKIGTPLTIKTDRENDRQLWITTKFGLCALDRITLQRIWYYPKNDLPWLDTNTAGFLEEDEEGYIWAHFLVNGKRLVGYFDKKNQKFRADSTLINRINPSRVRQLKKVKKNEIWAATSGGLIIIDTKHKKQTYLTPKNGLPLNSVKSIIPDKEGNVWINNGLKLCKYDGIAFDCFNVPNEIGGFMHCSSTLTRDGKVVFGGENGLLVFAPKEVEKDSIVPKVLLTDFRVFNKTVDLGKAFELIKTITIPYHDNIFSFGFSALHYHQIEDVKYMHQLEGFDEEWKETPGEEHRITYTNLSPGTFTFKVRAANSDNFWSPESEILQVQLIILPPWYRTNLAYAFWIFMLLGFIYWLHKFQLNRRLAEAEAHRLQELDYAKTQLYTNITHEFRTPLTVILGMAEQMKKDPKNWFNEGLKLIRRNGKQLLNLINQLLDLSKLESGNMPLKLVSDDIVSFLQYLTESFHSYADSKDIRLHFMSDLTELQMDFDLEKLQNVVSNLLSNAIKFTPAGGNVYVDLRIAKNGFIIENQVSKSLQLQIKDDGIGISPAHLSQIFDRFYQVDASYTRKGEGTGIGLALAKELVKAMGGSIGVESEKEKGTKFTILLPITQTGNKTQFEKSIEKPLLLENSLLIDRKIEQNTFPLSMRPRHLVLLVEDNEDVLTYLTSFLSYDYQIVTAINGQQGIDKALEIIPDLIVSDVMMPEKDGFEVCAALKTDERTNHIPIILLTAKSDQSSKVEGLIQGADAYLAKPFNREELLIRIEKMIALRKQLQERFQKTGILRQILKTPIQTKEEAFLQKVLQVIEQNLKDENFGMPQLCKEMQMSRSHLFRKLKALTGKSATHLIRSMRLEKAKELLQTTHFNVSEVCFEVGFNNPNYFSRIFKEEFGVSPNSVENGEEG